MEEKLNEEQIYYVLKQLTGSIHAIGETNHDNESYKNLKVFCKVFNIMLDDIIEESNSSDSYMGSLQRNGIYALSVLEDLKNYLVDILP